MKKIIISQFVCNIILLFAFNNLFAQSYSSIPPQLLSAGFDTLNTYIYNLYGTNTNDTAESGLNSEYKRWLTFWEKRKCNNPSTAQNTMTEYFKVLNEYLASEQQIGCQETNEFRGNWSLKGPKHQFPEACKVK